MIVRGPRTAMKSGPRLPRLEKALAQKRRPNTAINKNKLIKKKKKEEIFPHSKTTEMFAFVLKILFGFKI